MIELVQLDCPRCGSGLTMLMDSRPRLVCTAQATCVQCPFWLQSLLRCPRLRSYIVFDDLGHQIISCQCFSGEFVGDRNGLTKYSMYSQKLTGGSIILRNRLEHLSQSQPHEHMLLCCIPTVLVGIPIMGYSSLCFPLFEPLKDVINVKFWPALFGEDVSGQEQPLFFLPIMLGGPGINDLLDWQAQGASLKASVPQRQCMLWGIRPDFLCIHISNKSRRQGSNGSRSNVLVTCKS